MELTHRLVEILLESLIAVRQLGKLGGEITVRQPPERIAHHFHHFTHALIRLLLCDARLAQLDCCTSQVAQFVLSVAMRNVDRQIAHRNIGDAVVNAMRSEEHTSELQSLMRTSYAVFCLKTKRKQ